MLHNHLCNKNYLFHKKQKLEKIQHTALYAAIFMQENKQLIRKLWTTVLV